jgi:RNA polymerase-associated protein LEO1
MSDSDDPIELPEEVEDDLFGDEEEAVASDAERAVSDNELASDREEVRYGGQDNEDEDGEQQVKTKVVMGVQMFRHQVPKPQDGLVGSFPVVAD